MDEAPERPTPDLAAAAKRLASGGVVAFPTETVYGLGADALNPEAVDRVFRLKARPSRNPLIVHVTGPAMAATVTSEWPTAAERLARAFWPGPLTLVLPKHERVPGNVAGGGPTVAVRAPDHPIALALLFEAATPLVGPSANLSGAVSPTCADHVRAAFSADDVLVLDGGPCRVGIESTVIDLTSPTPRILRPGIIGHARLAAVLGTPVEQHHHRDHDDSSAAPPSPGLLKHHYAPKTPALLIDVEELEDHLEDALDDGVRVVVISHHLAVQVDDPHELIRMPGFALPYASALYDALRRADDLAAVRILIERPPTQAETDEDTAIWHAVHERLRRATAPR